MKEMKRIMITVAIAVLVIAMCSISLADRAYVTKTFRIPASMICEAEYSAQDDYVEVIPVETEVSEAETAETDEDEQPEDEIADDDGEEIPLEPVNSVESASADETDEITEPVDPEEPPVEDVPTENTESMTADETDEITEPVDPEEPPVKDVPTETGETGTEELVPVEEIEEPDEIPEPEFDPEGITLSIVSDCKPNMTEGETVTLTAILTGADGYPVVYHWLRDSGNGTGYQEVPDITGDRMQFPASKETLACKWKVIVDIDIP